MLELCFLSIYAYSKFAISLITWLVSFIPVVCTFSVHIVMLYCSVFKNQYRIDSVMSPKQHLQVSNQWYNQVLTTSKCQQFTSIYLISTYTVCNQVWVSMQAVSSSFCCIYDSNTTKCLINFDGIHTAPYCMIYSRTISMDYLDDSVV